MPSLNDNESKAYWRSLNDLADTDEFREMVAKEFPQQLDAVVDPVSRRRFVQLMGASLALAGLTGCDFMRWPKEKVLPYSRLPDERLPGKPVEYATTMELGGVGTGLLVKSYDGRPIKVEGNDLHPESLGATNGFAQASLLNLYDPDRSKVVRRKGSEEASSWSAFRKDLGQRMKKAAEDKGDKVVILSEATSSPTVAHLREQLSKRYKQLRWWDWEPVSRENELSEVPTQVLDGRYRVHFDLRRTDVIVSLDDDLFEAHPAALRLAREFADRRRRMDDERTMNRLYQIESGFTPTGSLADVRVPLQAGQILHFGLHLAAVLVQHEALKGKTSDELQKKLAEFATGPHADLVEQIAADLIAARGKSVIAVGPRQPGELHAVAHVLNGLLGNVDQTVRYTRAPEAGAGDLTKLVEEINDKKVDTLIIIGANPAYTAPANLDFATALQKVEWSAHLGLYQDETGRLTTWHLPRTHYLEAWGDARAYDGTIGLCQPLIAPLYGGKSSVELLGMMLAGSPDEKVSGYELVRKAHQASKTLAGGFENAWRAALDAGVIANSAAASVRPKQQHAPLMTSLEALPKQAKAASAQGLELVFTPCSKLHDGRFANNAWLQELPDPFTKITWDNAVIMSPKTAAELGGVKEGDLVSLSTKVAGKVKTLEVAAFILPGVADFSLHLALGYGRSEAAGVVGTEIGFDSYGLRGVGGMDFVSEVTLTKTGKTYILATTQDHHSIRTPENDAERDRRANELVREGSFDTYLGDPDFARNTWDADAQTEYGVGPNPEKTMLWNEPQEFEGRKWGMAIDMSVCTGCSACVVACQAENNIPVVGKSEVERGREMHWLRIDRYFTTKPLAGHGGAHGESHGEEKKDEDPKLPAFMTGVRILHQPMPCQQCENAPCESVCPVAATVHSRDGLNDMVYNRCVGTRYCSNNCPWKVRRFNYFYNHHGPFHPRSEPGVDKATLAGQELPKAPQSFVTKALPMIPTAAASTKVEEMIFNPEVTVRARGVMEKCTYCVQRIKAETIPARNAAVQAGKKEWKVEDGKIRVACQQVCPTQAIVFGDLNDPESQVAKLRNSNRSYTMLPELNARPRTSYMAVIRNLPTV